MFLAISFKEKFWHVAHVFFCQLKLLLAVKVSKQS
jgi:hypothetical protein